MIPSYLLGDVLSFDCETALLGDRVCEIGLSLFRNGEQTSSWSSFVNPTIPIDPETTKVHKIYDGDVENAPMFKDIAWYVYNVINSVDVCVAYNAAYDLGVLDKEFSRINMHRPLKPIVDPLILYRQWHKYSRGKTLVVATEKYGIPYIGAHRAMNDAVVTGKLLFKMAATKTDFPKTLHLFLTKQRRLVQEQFEDLQAYFTKVGKDKIDPPEYKYYDF